MTRRKMFGIMIWSALLRRRSRMLIALLAVAIGATVVSGLVTIYYDVPRQMGREFRSYGANLLLIPSGDQQFIGSDMVQTVSSLLPADKVVGIAPYLYERIKVNEQPLMAAGTDLNSVKAVSPYWQIRGEWPKEQQQEVLLGAEVAELLKAEPGQSITLGTGETEKSVKVAGIVRTGGSEEAFVFLPLDLLQSMLHKEGQISLAQVSVAATEPELNHFIKEATEKTPEVAPQLVKRVTQSEETVLGKLQSLVYLVTIVVLLLTLICVATTMMAVVTERRKEIGLKKALGADNRTIALEFLGEGLALGALGGLLGTGMGFFFAQAVSVNVFGRVISFQPLIALLALALSILVTGAACFIPVKMATEVEPAIVLRGE